MSFEESQTSLAKEAKFARQLIEGSTAKKELKILSDRLVLDFQNLLLTTVEVRLIIRLAEGFKKFGVELDRGFVQGITYFASMKRYYLIINNGKSKRESELEFNYRFSTLKRIAKQVIRDKADGWDLVISEFVRDQMLHLVFDGISARKGLKYERDPRDTTCFDFHLWMFRKDMTNQRINKPVETLALILEESGFLDDLGSKWKASTIRNKCTRANDLIRISKSKGACHSPIAIGPWPKINDAQFIDYLSNGCKKCCVAWETVLKDPAGGLPEVFLVSRYIGKRLPELGLVVKGVLGTLLSMQRQNDAIIDLYSSKIDSIVPVRGKAFSVVVNEFRRVNELE